MKTWARNETLWPLLVATVAAAIVLPGLGSYGFWEPQLVDIARHSLPDSALQGLVDRLQRRNDWQEQASRLQNAKIGWSQARELVAEAADLSTANADRRRVVQWMVRNFSDLRTPHRNAMGRHAERRHARLMQASVNHFGLGELSIRLPFALLAILLAVVVFGIGARLHNAHAGLFAAIALVGMPLFVFSARQVASDMPTMTGMSLIVFGGVGLARAKNRPVYWAAIDGAVLVLGVVLAAYGAGVLVGVAVPISALAGSALCQSDNRWRLRASWPAWLAMLGIATALWFAWRGIADLADARTSFAHAEQSKWLELLLGGTWQAKPDPKATFDVLHRHIAFSSFPWIGLAPWVIAGLAMPSHAEHRFGNRLLLLWIVSSWFVVTLFNRHVDFISFVALPGMAIAVGSWLERWRQNDRPHGNGQPVVALFALLTLLVVGKDIWNFPERMLSIHLASPMREFPNGVSLHVVYFVAAVLMGLLLVAALIPPGNCNWPGRRATWALRGCFALSISVGLFAAHMWIPNLSEKLSSRSLYESFLKLRDNEEKLMIPETHDAGAEFYLDGNFEPGGNRGTVLTRFLESSKRQFAIIDQESRCPFHREAGHRNTPYYVVDKDNANRLLLSNHPWSGFHAGRASDLPLARWMDDNPLSSIMFTTLPTRPTVALDANFDDQIKLVGADLPGSARSGSTLEMVFYYQVVKPLSRNWKVLVHIDGGGLRINGDHEPIGGYCGTSYWPPGNYVVDRFQVKADKGPGTYEVWSGFFVGSGGNFTNMKAVSGQPDANHRVKIGTIRLD